MARGPRGRLTGAHDLDLSFWTRFPSLAGHCIFSNLYFSIICAKCFAMSRSPEKELAERLWKCHFISEMHLIVQGP